MASVPSIPPLLCSTPPPIEFSENDDDSGLSPTLTIDDEEDVFGEYTSRNDNLTPDVPSLPRTPLQNELSSSTTSGFTEVPPTIFDDQLAVNLSAKVDNGVKVPIAEAFNYTIDTSQHHASVVVPEQENLTIEVKSNSASSEFVPVNNYEVKLEDIPDSDEEIHSPSKKVFDNKIDENSKEFFEIHMVNERGRLESADGIVQKNLSFDDNDSDDFAEFSTFERAAEPLKDIKFDVNNLEENQSNEFIFEADFSAFATTENVNEDITNDIETVIKGKEYNNDNPEVEFDDDDDDEFGDFAEAIVPTVENNIQLTTTTTPCQPTVNLSNLNERIKSMLQTIFPTDIDVNAEQDSVKESTNLNRLDEYEKLELPPIDAAKALKYQWTGSEIRDALIKSIGIDSKNIMFGDKWNPTMPRFAANLSCNPLQPLKPQSVSQNSTDHVTGKKSTDVPAVDFDWNSSGLVNPLDGSKEVSQSRETETHRTSQQSDDDITEQKSQQQQQSEQVSLESSAYNADTTPTTTTMLSTVIPADNINNNNNNQQWETEERVNYNAVESVQNVDVEDEVVTTSTYAGPLKETHIYTPPRGSETSLPRTLRAGYMTTPNTPINHNVGLRADPIDFDYEKAAAGIIIDETVVKKEYRDVEYNPDFATSHSNNASPVVNNVNVCDDDFSEFQSVPPSTTLPSIATNSFISNSPVFQAKQRVMNTSRSDTPNFADEMILSPAILLPQAVSMNTNNNNNNNDLKPKIEWGDTVSSINPEELARIEELFPQTKLQKHKETTSNSNSQKSTPTHQAITHNSPLTISAAIAQKEQTALDDDEWSDFVSVTIQKPTPSPTTTYVKTKQQQQMLNSNNNDDDWSDFVSNTSSSSSSAQVRSQIPIAAQFNSGAWQNANFYNNPLSFYHQSQQQNPVPSMHKVLNNNNNNLNIINKNNNVLPQQIHIMQDFSTAPPNMQQYQRQQQLQQQQQSNININNNNNQYQVGSAKVAPSISLIPDLGFIAPAMATHTAYINTLPKSTFGMKK